MKKITSLPYILWSIAFVVIPLALIVVFSFTTEDSGFTLENIFSFAKYGNTLVKSVNLAAIATAICFLIGFPLAYIISKASARFQRNLILFIMIPMWMSFLLRTYGWMTLLENEGIINTILGYIGIGPFQMINTEGAVVLGMVYNYLPFMILPLYSIMQKLDASVIEAAQDLGANNVQIFFKVIMPLSKPGIISGITMVFVPSISTFVISKLLGGGSNMLIGDLIQMQFLGGSYNPYLGSALSLILLVIMLVIMGIINSMDDDAMEGMFL